MGAPKGHIGNPAGRPKGAVGKATLNARKAIGAFVEGNVERLNGWLDQIAAESPEKAFRCVMDVCEFHIPKLARQELTGKDGNAIETKDVTQSDKDVIARYKQQLLTGQTK